MMFERITKRTAYFAAGGAVGAGVFNVVSEALLDFSKKPTDLIVSMIEMGLWMCLISIGISIGLLAAQNIYLKKVPNAESALKAIGIGALAGFAAGAAAQFIFRIGLEIIGEELFLRVVFQAACWGLGGMGVGIGVSKFVPNYPIKRAISAGFAGGFIGGIFFLVIGSAAMAEETARTLGLMILGAAIGFAISAAEESLREAWLNVIWGKNEVTTISLGEKPVILGSSPQADVHLPSKKYPPIAAIISIENGKVTLDSKITNQKMALPNGAKIHLGTIDVVINVRKGGADTK